MKTYYLVVLMDSKGTIKVPSIYNFPFKSVDKAELVILEFNKNYPDNKYIIVPIELPTNGKPIELKVA